MSKEYEYASLDNLTEAEREQLIQEAKGYEPHDFESYCAAAGWQEWMEKYTDEEECESCSEPELAVIEEMQRLIFNEAQEEKKKKRREDERQQVQQQLVAEAMSYLKRGLPYQTYTYEQCDKEWTKTLEKHEPVTDVLKRAWEAAKIEFERERGDAEDEDSEEEGNKQEVED